ncbi:tetratricopeptide repeat protein [Fontimonas sp. SYSU GA230001]|uniref:tetratricopeptide repeat protein n=1 Tax=Fontimonas sp. SYSU GA230001 TaxID=3142450 RepID=UPI0032B4545D
MCAERGLCALVAALLLGLGGCALPQRVDAPQATAAGAAESRRVYTDLIRSMLEQRQYYAALAHVQERQREGGDRDELRYLEAEARRGLGQFEAADALYKGLLRSPQAARAYHGLGLLHAGRDLNAAAFYLREAAQRAPTDADVRNDLGYALLRAGRHAEAMTELATAVELAPDSEKARNNLILLLLVRGDEAAVGRVVRDAAVAPETVSRLRQQARMLSAPRTVQGGSP